MITVKCHQCELTPDDTQLAKCTVCFKYYCEEHSHDMNGRAFCSHGCALYFFFGDEDTDREEEVEG